MGKILGFFVAALFIWSVLADSDDDSTSPSGTSSSASSSSSSSSPPPPPTWRVSRWTSEMDDSPAVSLLSKSDGIYTGAYGGPPGHAELRLRCLENTTTLFVKLNGHYLSDIQSYGRVTYRIDDQSARSMRMQESTDNEALGLWSGGRSIPVIRRFFGHDEVVMRITPFNQSSVTVTFPIDGIEEKIQPLRTACHW